MFQNWKKNDWNTNLSNIWTGGGGGGNQPRHPSSWWTPGSVVRACPGKSLEWEQIRKMFSGQKLKDWETWTGPEEAVATRPPDRIDGPDVEYENSCWMATVKRLIARKGDEKMLQDVYGQIRQCLLSFGSQFAIDQFALLTSCRWAICFRYLVSIFSDCWLGFQLIGYLVSGGLSKAGCDLPLDALRRVGRLLLLLLASTATSTSLQVDKVKIFFQGLILFFTTWPPCICCEDIPGINCWFDIIDWKKSPWESLISTWTLERMTNWPWLWEWACGWSWRWGWGQEPDWRPSCLDLGSCLARRWGRRPDNVVRQQCIKIFNNKLKHMFDCTHLWDLNLLFYVDWIWTVPVLTCVAAGERERLSHWFHQNQLNFINLTSRP